MKQSYNPVKGFCFYGLNLKEWCAIIGEEIKEQFITFQIYCRYYYLAFNEIIPSTSINDVKYKTKGNFVEFLKELNLRNAVPKSKQ